uniref:EF-hand domain-containing protein n=1 Tax=Macrostomum lignano TaxID=282301 RepID=A0A1I8FA03_9PLAT
SLLLGQEPAPVLSDLRQQLDADKDKKLNAAELRRASSACFRRPVRRARRPEQGEVLRPFLEDYERVVRYNVGDDILSSTNNHFVQEESGRISPKGPVPGDLGDAAQAGHELLLARLTNAHQKLSSEINYETFRNVITDLFSINMQLLARSSASSSTNEGSSVKHPLYQEMLAQRVASFQADRRDAGSLRCLLEKVAEELIAMSNEEDPYNAREDRKAAVTTGQCSNFDIHRNKCLFPGPKAMHV